MTGAPYDLLLAHHPIVLALPFFVPALLVVLAVGAVIWRDRHAPPDDAAPDGSSATSGGEAASRGAAPSTAPPGRRA